jgi:diamine N-acetyltransferase
MSKDVKLQDVTAANWRAVAGLKLADEQRSLLASNVYSIAQSKFDEAAQPRAIYAGADVVGFLMYDVPEIEDEDQTVTIYRFMIDRDHQSKGYGRAALTLAIEEIRQIPGIEKISISYLRNNEVAKRFYATFGFVEIESDAHDDEKSAELVL